jgi:hypothetical protein
MIWAVLALVGVPLWLCAMAVLTLIVRNRKLRTRGGDVPVRRRLPGKARWTRGHGVWVHDVFAFRGSPAMWSESLVWVTGASTRGTADPAEAKKLRRLGDHPVVAVLTTGDDGETVEFAASEDRAVDLLGPFSVEAASPPPRPERSQEP